SGGSMAFDAYGDLWIGVGSNTGEDGGFLDERDSTQSEEWGASSTHGLRGSVLRIHPDNSAKGYAVPAGNFGEYFAAQTGNNQYLDTAKVMPEVYAKGTRNPYSLQVDPVRRWLLFGDVGPETISAPEEYNLVLHPAFLGWPY